MPLDMKVPG